LAYEKCYKITGGYQNCISAHEPLTYTDGYPITKNSWVALNGGRMAEIALGAGEKSHKPQERKTSCFSLWQGSPRPGASEDKLKGDPDRVLRAGTRDSDSERGPRGSRARCQRLWRPFSVPQFRGNLAQRRCRIVSQRRTDGGCRSARSRPYLDGHGYGALQLDQRRAQLVVRGAGADLRSCLRDRIFAGR